MQLDPKKCPPGTVGFLPAGSIYDFEGYGEGSQAFDEFKKPDVVLNDDRQWIDNDNEPLSDGAKVFATWRAAVQATIDEDRRDCEEIIREAQADLAQCDMVQRWLNEAH